MYKKVLVPVALDHGHDPSTAISIAKSIGDDGAELVLLHVMEEIPAYVNAALPDDLFDAARTEIKAKLDHVAQDAGANAKGYVIEGHPGTSINSFAKANGIDCIVIASHRPEWTDYLLGSTAARVVRHASCSVHVIR